MKKNEFNPIKEDEAGKKARRMVWSTAVLEKALQGIEAGKRLIANPFYEKNTKLLKSNLVFERTPYEIQEWMKCKGDVIYFAKKCKLMTPEGIKNIELRPYQEQYLRHLENHRLSIYLSARQSGKTTTSAIFLLWYVLFNFDKNALVLGNKGKTAKEILDKIKKMFYELPYYLKPGIEKWNEMELCFDNGCRIMAETTTTRSGIGFTYHCVLADEFAHIPANIMDEFYENLFPTVTAAKARFIISSTQNGYNLFQRIYSGAVAGENEYAPFKTDWYEVPEWNPDKRCWEKRDEEWRRKQVANYGGEDAFNRQFGTSFDSNANTLISNNKLREVSARGEEYVDKDYPGVMSYFVWKQNFDIEDLKKYRYLITCDLAEGGGNDYTIFLINKLTYDKDTRKIRYENVGMYRHNDISLEKSALILSLMCRQYMTIDRYFLSFEMNTYGELFVRYLMDIINENDIYTFNEECFLKFKKQSINSKKIETRIGIRLDVKEKLYGCMNFKTRFESGYIINKNSLFINELYNFCDNNGNNTYKASYGHDDIVMAQLQVVFFERSSIYNTFLDDIIAEEAAGENNLFRGQSYSIYDDIFKPIIPYQENTVNNFTQYSMENEARFINNSRLQ